MLKELQEKIKLEIERMQNKLVEIVKGLLNEENVLATVSEDLNDITVVINKNIQDENKFTQNEFVFAFKIAEHKVLKNYSAISNVLILQNNRIIGSYALPSTINYEALTVVFSAIDSFRAEELVEKKEAAPAE